VGTKVAALMGGLGRTINGSYAEYTRARVENVASIESDLPWEELAAIPESYATAWDLPVPQPRTREGPEAGHPRGMSSFGQAALHMSGKCGAEVIVTTRKGDSARKLESLGAKRIEVEGPDLSTRIPERKQIDAVLDLVGNSTILDSLAMLRRGGRACLAGFLGGLAPVSDFNPVLQMSSSVHFSFFGSFVFGTPQFPISDVPLQAIATDVATGSYKAKPVRVFRFEEIREAHKLMESGQAGGKMLVRL
jgi:NADPH:quinone reductase